MALTAEASFNTIDEIFQHFMRNPDASECVNAFQRLRAERVRKQAQQPARRVESRRREELVDRCSCVASFSPDRVVPLGWSSAREEYTYQWACEWRDLRTWLTRNGFDGRCEELLATGGGPLTVVLLWLQKADKDNYGGVSVVQQALEEALGFPNDFPAVLQALRELPDQLMPSPPQGDSCSTGGHTGAVDSMAPHSDASSQACATPRETAPPRAPTQNQPPVVLPTDPTHPVLVLGKQKPAITIPQRNVIATLLKCMPKSLSREELEAKSGHKDARHILKRLARDADWRKVILFSGRTRTGYRVQSPQHRPG
jgi:hypothetical protein